MYKKCSKLHKIGDIQNNLVICEEPKHPRLKEFLSNVID